ncbi:hypothetical protein M0804_012209 [Polistes exclamans]|nr:hypothetical protein M0804_012209 [Polistes exclamans]
MQHFTGSGPGELSCVGALEVWESVSLVVKYVILCTAVVTSSLSTDAATAAAADDDDDDDIRLKILIGLLGKLQWE